MSTIYHLFDLDYKIYVIADNVLELPGDSVAHQSKERLLAHLRKMPLHVISLDEACTMLSESSGGDDRAPSG